MNSQLSLEFAQNKSFGGQLERLYKLLQVRKVTCEDAQPLGISGSAFARRIKDLKEKHKLNIVISKAPYIRSFDGKEVKISQYELVQ